MLKNGFSLSSIHSGSLILVNRRYPWREGRERPFLVPAQEQNEEVLLERRAAVLLTQLMNDISGWSQIVPVSGWRSALEQQDIWNQSMAEHGRAFTEQYVAVPGHSEHQTGLAIDLGLKQSQIDFICPDFPYSGICQTFREKAASYGFIQRYPQGKEQITGISHEPWHFRYVGMPHAAIMTEKNFTLEEYLFFLESFPYGDKWYEYQQAGCRIAVCYLAADRREEWLPEAIRAPWSVSGNNMDGFIITEWRTKYGYEQELRRA